MARTQDDDDRSRLARRADDAAGQLTWDYQIVDAIIGADAAEDDRQRLADAFRYHVRRDADEQDRFGPMVVFDDGQAYPAPLGQISELNCELWESVLAQAAHPRVRARLHDLLFERKWGDVGAHLLGAVEAYFEHGSQSSPPSLESVDALRRADHLARLGRRTDLLARITLELISAAGSSIEDPDAKPGVTLPLLRTLVDGGIDDPAVDDLLQRARQRFPGAWHSESTIELQRRRALDESARVELDRQLVECWLEEAERADPLVALLHRERAAKLARERGLSEQAERIAIAMQAADPPELGRLRVEVPTTVTREQVDDLIDSLVHDTWWDSILRVLVNGPPTGNVVRNREAAAKLASEYPLQALFPKVRLGEDGLPRHSARTDADQLDDQLTDVEMMTVQSLGTLLVEALRRAGAAFCPTVDEITESVVDRGCDRHTAVLIAQAVDRFNREDFDGAAYTGLPVIERLCRDLLLAIDAPLYRVQRDRAPGQYPGLGAMLPLLAERGLDESWHRFLRTILVAPNGFNLRNEILHGFVDEVGSHGAGLVLIGALYLSTLAPTDDSAPPPATEE